MGSRKRVVPGKEPPLPWCRHSEGWPPPMTGGARRDHAPTAEPSCAHPRPPSHTNPLARPPSSPKHLAQLHALVVERSVGSMNLARLGQAGVQAQCTCALDPVVHRRLVRGHGHSHRHGHLGWQLALHVLHLRRPGGFPGRGGVRLVPCKASSIVPFFLKNGPDTWGRSSLLKYNILQQHPPTTTTTTQNTPPTTTTTLPSPKTPPQPPPPQYTKKQH